MENNLVEQFTNLNSANSIGLFDLFINLVLASALCFILSLFYVKFSTTLTNKEYLAKNFIIIGVTTTLIIAIIKSSLALSLGLVGALSIVRFRAAIKEPEELAYLFLTIAIGLGFGSGNRMATIISFVIIILLLFVYRFFNKSLKKYQIILLSITLKNSDNNFVLLNNNMKKYFNNFEIKKFDSDGTQSLIIYKIKISNIEKFEEIKNDLDKNSDIIDYNFTEELNIF